MNQPAARTSFVHPLRFVRADVVDHHQLPGAQRTRTRETGP